MQLSPLDVATLQLRRRSFQLALANLRVQGALIVSAAHDVPRFAVCPCCAYPTLSSRGYHDTCCICWWEDDGQDDPDADRVVGGPNSDYSLTEGRANFADHGVQYRTADLRCRKTAKAAPERARLVAAYDALLPDVHPWSFISALPRIDELHTALSERVFGKRNVRRWRAVRVDERQRADRDWEIWTSLSAVTMPRAWWISGPPSVTSHRARTFVAFVRRVDAGISKRLGPDAPVHSRSRYGHWSAGEREVWMMDTACDGKVQLMFEPFSESRADEFVGIHDNTAVDVVVDQIARFFAETATHA